MTRRAGVIRATTFDIASSLEPMTRIALATRLTAIETYVTPASATVVRATAASAPMNAGCVLGIATRR